MMSSITLSPCHSKLLDWCLRFFVLLSFYAQLAIASGNNSSHNNHNNNTHNNHGNGNHGGHGGGIHIFRAEFQHVAKPFAVCAWVLAASIAKIGESL